MRKWLIAAANMPETLVRKLNQEIVQVLNDADVKERPINVRAEAVGSSPQQFAATIKSEMIRTGEVIKDAGIRGE